MKSWRQPAAAVACGLLVATAATATARAATTAAGARTGTVVSSCANPLLERDTTGWGAHTNGAAGSRVAVSAHVVAKYAYVQPSSNGADPEMYLPQKDVAAGEQWRLAMDTWAYGPATAVTVRMQVDWYGSGSAYIGHANGPEVPVTAGGTEHWTRIAGDFTAPSGATRANVTARLAAPAGMSWAATACDYQPVGATDPTTPPTTSPTTSPTTPPTTPPAQDTAAARFGWGTALAAASDEFNYGSAASPAVPDPAKWSLPGDGSACWNGHAAGRRCGRNTRVTGTYVRETGEAGGDSGWLGSKTSLKYGRWEIRARSQATGPDNGNEYHPVALLWPDSGTWPDDGEYDYMENSSPGEQCAVAFLHYPQHDQKQEKAEKCGVDLTQWHNFGFEWTGDHVTGYLDGAPWFTFDQGCIQCPPGPMYQTFQLDDFDGTNQQPATFDVDWTRVYTIPGLSQVS
jgi:hypothetical protein